MLYNRNGKRNHVTASNRGLTRGQVVHILDYLQGAVYCWCKNRPKEEFSVQKLFGGKNTDWGGTPIQDIYDYRQSVKEAAKDCGHFLRLALQEDRRKFKKTSTTRPGQGYIWTGK